MEGLNLLIKMKTINLPRNRMGFFNFSRGNSDEILLKLKSDFFRGFGVDTQWTGENVKKTWESQLIDCTISSQILRMVVEVDDDEDSMFG